MPRPTEFDFAKLEAWLERILAAPAASRSALLTECKSPELRDELRLLVAEADSAGPLDRVPTQLARHALLRDEQRDSRAGTTLGAYRLIDLLGEGGMATVWRAERSDGTIVREVALKCLKIGLATPDLRGRFLREQQILGRLTHPHIARLYDAGVSADGVPYLVMERVDGAPITRWCEEHQLGLRARLELFRKVLGAVAFAHQNLTVHRDLKPANIFVGVDGAPKLLDFGIAKLLDTDTEATRTQTRALTPGYAAPEQFDAGAITTATDVYALGVILCELLCGSRPVAPSAGDASPPSALILEQAASHADTAGRLALARGYANAPALARALRGDLDTLVATALQRDPARRYAGAAEFDGDIERYLLRRPLRAQRDSVGYRLRKFARRNWIAVSATGAVIAALGIGVGLALWQAHEARRSAARAEAVQNFLLGIFDAAQAGPRGSTVLTNRELAERAATSLRERLANEPDANAQLLLAVGRVYRKMSLNDQAGPLFERAVTMQRATQPSDPLALADSLAALADAYDATGEYAQAKTAYDEAISLQRQNFAAPARIADTLTGMAMVDIDLGKTEARETIDAAMAELARVADPEPELRLRALMVRAAILRRAGDTTGSIVAAREALAFARKNFRDDAPQVARAWNVLGTALRQTGQLDEAEHALRELIRYDRDIAHQIEPSHLYSLGTLQFDLGDYASAVDTLNQALETERVTTGADVIDIGSFEEPLARALLELSHADEAEILARDAVARYEHTGAEAAGELAQMKLTLANILNARAKGEEARPLFVQVFDASRDPHTKLGREQHLFAQLGIIAGDAPGSTQALQTLLNGSDFAAVADPLARLRALTDAAGILLLAHDYAAAENRARSAVEIADHLPLSHPQAARARLVRAEALLALYRGAEAKALVAAAAPPLAARFPRNHPLRIRADALARQTGLPPST